MLNADVTCPLIRIYGTLGAPLSQGHDKFESGHAWHILIDDETLTRIQVIRAIQFFSTLIGDHGETINFKDKLERISNSGIVVNHDNERVCRRHGIVSDHWGGY